MLLFLLLNEGERDKEENQHIKSLIIFNIDLWARWCQPLNNNQSMYRGLTMAVWDWERWNVSNL